MCGCCGCISWWLLSHIPVYCCRLRKQVLGTNGNHLTMQSGYIDITVRCTWPVLLCTESNLGPLQCHKIHYKHVTNSLRRAVPSGQETGRWWQRKCDSKPNSFRAWRVQGRREAKGCQGGWKSMESNSYHIWKELHTAVTEVHWVLALCQAHSHAAMPSVAFAHWKCVTWMPYKTANKLCKQCHLVDTKPLT